ncbi:extracellular solute-binding protein [Pseudonocardia parietis]|uniref:Iron(III) transport system substrate-binding protein n=1 Tax=Pseudonocardia parietis TaxID=570936 RepID=A0ABS4VU58_9PSEU|nr:extracellular solute-binding protein [Pseudonocardia parietis]MBP2367477.1 iron(III) transport system substrate-binding protein [Pseudonocardia parietis]
MPITDQPTSHHWRLLATGAVVALALTACGGAPADDEAATAGGATAAQESLTVYSGRSQGRVEAMLQQFEAESGIALEVRYGDTAELVAQVLEEGDASPADVFFAQDAGALGALSAAGRLTPLPEEVFDGIAEGYVAPDETWAATSARARVIAYDAQSLTPEELPQSLDDLLDPRWEGQIGFPPGNSSWNTFVTAVRLERGDDGARAWLEAFNAQNPERYSDNHGVIDGIENDQIQIGLVNHYYIYSKMEELGEENLRTRNHHVGGDPLGLVNVAGAGVMDTAADPARAQQLVGFLTSEVAQQYFADTSGEYSVRSGITSTVYEMPDITELEQPDIELAELRSLEQTLEMLQETGIS